MWSLLPPEGHLPAYKLKTRDIGSRGAVKFRMTSHREAKGLNTCTFLHISGNSGRPGSLLASFSEAPYYWCLIPRMAASIPHVMRMVFRSRLVKQDLSYLARGDISHTEHLRQEVKVAREENRLEPSSWGYTRSLGCRNI